MEEDRDISLYGKVAVAEANLRDDTFWKLTEDFFGPQTGEGLEFDKSPCKNKVLIQIGLMREDSHLSWISVVEWLQKIFPKHKSADFRRLIERGIATTLSLGSDARQSFLESTVNFNFVGPICDSIGVERTDLLKMKDFAERAKSIEVITNGLILELTNFVTREKLDPVILVTWLRNFNPAFCQDGDIQKAYKSLRTNIKKFRLLYRNYETTSHRRNKAMENLLQSPFELVPRKVVSQRLGAKKHVKKETPGYENVMVKDECEYVPVLEEHSDDKAITVNWEGVSQKEKDENYSLRDVGDQPNNGEGHQEDKRDFLTLLDVAMLNAQKLADVYGGNTNVSKQLSMDLLKSHYALTSKQHPEIMELERKITSVSENISLAPPLTFLHHNAHFLVDIHDAIESQLMSFEGEIMQSTGQKLGRDGNPKFKTFVNFSESVTSRYIHMASDVLSPHAPAEQNYRRHWVAFCKEKENPSKLALDMSNEFNKYFESAAGLTHHHQEIPLFFSDLLELKIDDCPNINLESVVADANDDVIQSLVCVLGIIYLKILGPYLQLLKSDAEYTLFSQYILCLYQKLLEWCADPSLLLESEGIANVFLQIPLQEKHFDRVPYYLCQPHTDLDLIKAGLQKMLKVIVAVTEKNLKDFLPGGIYSESPTPHTCQQLSACMFAILMAEYPHVYSHDGEYKEKNERPDKSSDFSWSSGSEDSSLDSSFGDDSPDSRPRSSGKTTRPRQRRPYNLKRACIDKNKMKENVGGITSVHDDGSEDSCLDYSFGDDSPDFRPRSSGKTTHPGQRQGPSNLKRACTDKNKMKEKIGGITYVHDDNGQPAFHVPYEQHRNPAHDDPMVRAEVVATVSKNGGPCKTQQDVDKLLARFDGYTRAEKREALHCEMLYQKMVLDNNNPNLDFLSSTTVSNTTVSNMSNRLKLALPCVKPSYTLVLAPRLTQKKSL